MLEDGNYDYGGATSILSTWNKSPKAVVATGPETSVADSSKSREVCFHLVTLDGLPIV